MVEGVVVINEKKYTRMMRHGQYFLWPGQGGKFFVYELLMTNMFHGKSYCRIARFFGSLFL